MKQRNNASIFRFKNMLIQKSVAFILPLWQFDTIFCKRTYILYTQHIFVYYAFSKTCSSKTKMRSRLVFCIQWPEMKGFGKIEKAYDISRISIFLYLGTRRRHHNIGNRWSIIFDKQESKKNIYDGIGKGRSSKKKV